jgi:hypothetical protein
MGLASSVVLFLIAVVVIILFAARKTIFWSWLMASKPGTKNRSAKRLVRVIVTVVPAIPVFIGLWFVIYTIVFWGGNMLWFSLTGDTIFEYMPGDFRDQMH